MDIDSVFRNAILKPSCQNQIWKAENRLIFNVIKITHSFLVCIY